MGNPDRGEVLTASSHGRLIPAAALALILSAPTAEAAETARELGSVLPAWSALPFVGILLSIALFPLLAPRFWHHHYPEVSAAWALAFAVPFVAVHGRPAVGEILHTVVIDYVPFVVLIGTLFTIGGGILIRGTPRGSPAGNAAIMVAGTLLASWIGTTGAAVLLIRPLLRANRDRRRSAHTVVFFVFLVANIGGALTPLGDPPLFLGFLHGVPFFWTLHLWDEALLVATLTLVAFIALDLYQWRRESPEVRAPRVTPREPFRVEGWHNFFFLAGVLAAVMVSGVWHAGSVSVLGVHQEVQNLLRDAFLLLMAAGSWLTTARRTREENGYTWGPIREVAILFAGIFATIIPALLMLRAGEDGALSPVIRAVQTPAGFFWAAGGLSSFLDNAPTYLTFLSTALGRLFPGVPEREGIMRLIVEHGAYLRAVATGAVFMGANTYIGNAPNFMVKSIAEEAGVEMPSFFGYILRYSLPCLIPIFLLVTWVFFG
ncbi:MAG TPA: sodium:proton antiporter [Thermoanaerobaculaceae bacterium]|nr:sodium:proton antiporter [Thermoanaerobaculaceae bacterium]